MIPSFPKIFALGSKQTQSIFDGPIEITEKLDGSAIGFGVIDGELHIRSKSTQINIDAPDKMFSKAVDIIKGLSLEEGIFYYGEYLKAEKHNTLTYARVPQNHIALYGILTKDKRWLPHVSIKSTACSLGLDVVPILSTSPSDPKEYTKHLLTVTSYLGGCKIEGIVIKNYHKELICGGQIVPIMMGKYVSEEFREVHHKEWKANSVKSKWDTYKEGFNTVARWTKALEHLRDKGELTESPKDIGKVIKEVKLDIQEEEIENIKTFLYSLYIEELLRDSVKGLPEWYKRYRIYSRGD